MGLDAPRFTPCAASRPALWSKARGTL